MTDIQKITSDSPESRSLDITKQNIEQLKQIFPDVFTEGKVDFEALKAALGEIVDDSAERYNFTWSGKAKARQIAQTPSTGTLLPSKEKSVNWDTTENLFIEGDNLEVLKLLQKSYHKKVKMIYIDPPYNTGGDFVYKDNFRNSIQNYLEQTGQVDSEGNRLSANSDISGRYHSDWLSMVYPRLKLARNLLSDDGVICIQIDDHELKNLRQVCDEIFGEDNFINLIVVKMSHLSGVKMSHVDKKLPKIKEFILVYAKNKDYLRLSPIYEATKWDDALSRYTQFIDNIDDDYSKWTYMPVRKAAEKYKIDFSSETDRELFLVKNAERIFRTARNRALPTTGVKGVFTKITTATGLEKFVLNDEEVLFASEKMQMINDVLQPANVLGDIWTDIGINNLHNEGGVDFRNGKKPIKLLKRLIKLFDVQNSIVLDFFAGSSSTAHAVSELNQKDRRNNRFIMIQLPEPITDSSTAFETISDLSLRRLNNIFSDVNNILEDTSPVYGYKFLKLDHTNIQPWDEESDNLEDILRQSIESIKPDRTAEDVLYEILLKYGIELTVPVETEIVNGRKVFVVGAGALIVCLEDDITSELVEGIAKLKDELDPETTQVVFKDAGFADSNVKTNAIQILKQAGIDDVKSI